MYRWPRRSVAQSIAVAIGLLACRAEAQFGSQARYRQIEEPTWLKLQLTRVDTGILAEGNFEETTTKDTGQSSTYDRIFVGPSLGLGFQGSVYHPNLLRFRFDGEGAYGWGEQTSESNSRSQTQDEMQYYGRFRGIADILANKPLNGSIFGNYGRDYREYDFFTRSTVDTLAYGSRVAYSSPAIYVSGTYNHVDEDVTDTTAPSGSHQDTVGLNARNDRTKGATSLDYTFSHYLQENKNVQADTTDNTITLSDGEQLGSHDQVKVQSSTSYNHRDSESEVSDQFTANASLLADHRPNLSSYYDFNFDRYETGDFTSDNYTGHAELRHRLYQSLSSTLIARASDFESSDSQNTGYTRRYGGGISEGYTKRLGTEHRLQIDNYLFVEHVDQEGIGRAINESHVFPSPPSVESFLLNLPNVIESSIRVTDSSDLIEYVLNIDYQVVPNGSRIEIRRISGGTIPAGSAVLVDYQAEPSPPGSYEALTESAGIRVDFWKNLWGVYARMSLSRNNAPADLRVQDVTSYTFGSDVTWRWLNAGAEYAFYDSEESAYTSARFFQSFSFNLDDGSALNVGLSQSFTDYQDGDRHEEDYRFTTRYNRRLTRHLQANVDAGVDLRRGEGVDQTLAVFRPELNYVYGRTTIQVRYDFEYNLFLEEERKKHMFSVRYKREF